MHCPGVPWILVGTKSDLRDSDRDHDIQDSSGNSIKASDIVSESEAEEIVKECNGKQYIECSALKMKNLKTVFDEAVRYVFNCIYLVA